MLPALRHAVADYSMLLSKQYAPTSALKLVGDHFSLTQRQRMAVMRSACSDTQLANRLAKEIPTHGLKGNPILIDGYNLLITTESALSGAFVFAGRDHCIRDVSGIHGSYRKVAETTTAIELIASCLADLAVANARWLLDAPISNSGRLKTLIRTLAEQNHWPWQVELLPNPDKELIAADHVVATSDSNILDRCSQWTNLTAHVIRLAIPDDPAATTLLDLAPDLDR